MTSRNPVDWMVARTRMSRASFTYKYGFGQNLLLRISQGRFLSITPRIVDALLNEWAARGIPLSEFSEEFGTLDIDEAYQEWVKKTRISHRSAMPHRVADNTALLPFARLVAEVGSISGMAKLLVIPDIYVQSYSDGKHAIMPEVLKKALHEVGYPYVEELEKAQRIWMEE